MTRYLVTAERDGARFQQTVESLREAALITTRLECDGWREVRFLALAAEDEMPCPFCRRGDPCPADRPERPVAEEAGP